MCILIIYFAFQSWLYVPKHLIVPSYRDRNVSLHLLFDCLSHFLIRTAPGYCLNNKLFFSFSIECLTMMLTFDLFISLLILLIIDLASLVHSLPLNIFVYIWFTIFLLLLCVSISPWFNHLAFFTTLITKSSNSITPPTGTVASSYSFICSSLAYSASLFLFETI